MKAETNIARHFSGAPESYSQEMADSHGFGNQIVSNAKCVHAAEGYEDFPIEDIEKTVPERFEKIVRMYPDRLAVKMGERSFTYVELNRAANRIAHTILGRRGPGSEPIALMLEHGIDVIAAILGVLKAGKFYVALDPILPSERIRYVLGDSGASLIVTNNVNRELACNVAGAVDPPLLDIGEIDASSDSDGVGFSGSANDAAILYYTSGSTSKPKGVVLTHRSLLHNASTYVNQRCTCYHDRFTLFHSVSFSSASIHLFRSLLTGAALFPFDIKSQGIGRLSSWLEEEQITLCHLPPLAFRQLAESRSGLQNLSHLRAIHLSGAPITPVDFDLYKRHCAVRTSFCFHMGATETAVICSATVGRNFRFPSQGFPIGYVRPDTRIVLLDDTGNEITMPNEVGEIAVRSRYLASGYWGRPDLTSTKFLPDPSGGDERIYLTGDLGQMLPDGFYVHMGRKDFMVKIRGYRVEPGEIESALLAHPGIKSAGVAAWDREQGEKYLVAYVVSRDGGRPTASELHDFLKAKLPDYMIPSSYMFLESLPFTNGKLDRSQLPLPNEKRPDLGHPYAPPGTELESSLVQMWEKILEVRPVGIHDDFFELGGHSLLASQLFIEIEKVFGKQLPLTTLFWAKSVEQLALVIQHEEWSAPWSLMFPIQTSGSRPPFFWVYGETSDILLPRYLGSDQPLYGLMHEARTGKKVLSRTIPEIAANHLREIQKVQPQGPYYLGGFCFGGMVAFEIAQQLKKQGQEVGLLFLIDLATLVNWRSRFETTESFGGEISRHVSGLVKIGVREKFEYVRVRVRDRIDEILIKGKNIALTVARNAYFATGRPLPVLLRPLYITSVDHWAMRHYEPEMYPGDLILFKSEQRHYDPGWVAKFIVGKLHLHELSCGHSDLLKEPDIATWASELRTCLEKAQTTRRQTESSRTPRKIEHRQKSKQEKDAQSV